MKHFKIDAGIIDYLAQIAVDVNYFFVPIFKPKIMIAKKLRAHFGRPF